MYLHEPLMVYGKCKCKGYLIYIDPIGKLLHVFPYMFSDVALEKTERANFRRKEKYSAFCRKISSVSVVGLGKSSCS